MTIGTHLLSATCGLVRRASQHTVQRNHGMDADTPEFRSAPSVNNVSTWISRPPHSAMERLARRRSGLGGPFGQVVDMCLICYIIHVYIFFSSYFFIKS